jgi:hypothetical protein
MNEDTLNLEIRKFLKKVGITSQRDIEKAVREALQSGQLSGKEHLNVKMSLEITQLGLSHVLEDTIALE